MKFPTAVAASLLLPLFHLGAAPHPSLPKSELPDCLGVNIHFTDPRSGEMEMLAAAGFKWVRMDLLWEATERDKGVYDFSAYDRLAVALGKFHIRALFILDYGNRLYDEGLPPHTDAGRAAFSKWAAAAVKHFAGKGYIWELWNEPNIDQFWKPKPDVEQYIALAKSVGPALRSAAPGEAFIGPATSTIDLKFIEACCKAGLLESWDALSMHPYRQSPPDTVKEDYRKVREIIAKYGPHGKEIPIISSEWGYSSGWKDFDEEKQARDLTGEIKANLASGIPLSIWYDWHDDGSDPKEPEHHFGLVHEGYHKGRDPVYDPKPAYEAVKALREGGR